MQEYAFIIPVIVVIWVMLIGIRIGAYLDKKAGKNEYKPVVVEKACPPHKWRYLEQPGFENTYYMKCQLCHKTPREISEGV